jgi:hypothetical protein
MTGSTPRSIRVAAVGDLHCTLWGYEDARLLPHRSMSEEDASTWTAASDETESRPVGAEAIDDAVREP